jgi:O-methyltransferase
MASDAKKDDASVATASAASATPAPPTEGWEFVEHIKGNGLPACRVMCPAVRKRPLVIPFLVLILILSLAAFVDLGHYGQRTAMAPHSETEASRALAQVPPCEERHQVQKSTTKGPVLHDYENLNEKREPVPPCPNHCLAGLCQDSKCVCPPGHSGVGCSYVPGCTAFKDPKAVQRSANSLSGYDGMHGAFAHAAIANQVLANKVPGDFVELGVYRGGSSAVLAMMIQDCTHKRHWAFDSFMGHPDVGPLNGGMGSWVGTHIGTLDQAKANIQKLAPKMTDRIVWRKGFYNVTWEQELPDAIAYLHIDCDWYECIYGALDKFYPRVQFGGAIVIDDASYYDFTRAALYDWIRTEGLYPAIRSVPHQASIIKGEFNPGSVFWFKGYQGGHKKFGPGNPKPLYTA